MGRIDRPDECCRVLLALRRRRRTGRSVPELRPGHGLVQQALRQPPEVAGQVVGIAREIILQHTTPRNMATAGRRIGTFIQALRHLGPKQIDDLVLAKLRRQITDADRASFSKDLMHAPDWIGDLLRPMIEPSPAA